MTLQWLNDRPLITATAMAMDPNCCCGGPCDCCSDAKINGVLITVTDVCDTDTPGVQPCDWDFSHLCACAGLNVSNLLIPANEIDDPVDRICDGILVQTNAVTCSDAHNPGPTPESFDRVSTYAIQCFNEIDLLIAVEVALYTSPWDDVAAIKHVGVSGEYFVLDHNRGVCKGIGGIGDRIDATRGAWGCNDLNCGPAPPAVCESPCYDPNISNCPPPTMTMFIQ